MPHLSDHMETLLRENKQLTQKLKKFESLARSLSSSSDSAISPVIEDSLLLQTLIEHAPCGITIQNKNTVYQYVNPVLETTLNINVSDMMGKTTAALFPEKYVKTCGEHDREVLENRQSVSREYSFKSGERDILFAVEKFPVYDSNDQITAIGSIFIDVSERMAALETIESQKHKLSAILDSSLDAMVQMSGKGLITGWNRQAENIFGWSEGEALGQILHQLIVPQQFREAHVKGLKHYLDTGIGPVLSSMIEIKALHRHGHEFPVELSISSIGNLENPEFNAFIRDISKRKEDEYNVWNQANFDSITELPNRNMFLNTLDQEIAKSKRHLVPFALLFIDLDNFKKINDTYGHDIGDAVLKEVANRIRESVREVDTVSRLSGDEFTVILTQLDTQVTVERICRKILKAISGVKIVNQKPVQTSASLGITISPQDSVEAKTLLKFADQAMYVAKKAGKNQFKFHSAEV
jgi:diguanylate cyclase (GGDEF)-like protein/PAS domain S-box-containing protein